MSANPTATIRLRPHARQRPPASPAHLPRLTDRSKLAQMKRHAGAVLRVKPRRYLEDRTGRSGAWWEHVAAGQWGQVRPTLIDWYTIRAVAGVLGDEAALDGELLTHLTRVMQCVGALVVAVTDMIGAVRRKAKA